MKKRCLALLVILTLALAVCAHASEVKPVAETGPIVLAAQSAVQDALKKAAAGTGDAWTKALLSQPLQDFSVSDNPDLTGAVATFSVYAYDPGASRLTGSKDAWLDTVMDNIRSSRVQGSAALTVSEDGAVALDGDLEGFTKQVASAARSAKASFDLANLRIALTERLLPQSLYGEDGAPTRAFSLLCDAYAGKFSPAELEVALSLQKNASLGVDKGPGELRLVYYVASGDSTSEKAYEKTVRALSGLDLANAYTEEEVARVYAHQVAAEARPFIGGSTKGEKQVMTIDFAKLLSGDMANDDFSKYVEAQVKAFRSALPGLVEKARSLPDYPLREMPPTGRLSGTDEGTRVTLTAREGDSGYYVYLVNEEGETAHSMFVRGGGTCVSFIREGVYTIYVAKGTDWYGPVMMFDEAGQYCASTIKVLDDMHYHVISLDDAETDDALDTKSMTFNDIRTGV